MYSLPKADQEVLSGLGYKEKLEAIDKAILVNASFLAQIVEDPEIFGHDLDENEEDPATADGDIAGRYWPFDSKSKKKKLSHNALKDHLSNLTRTRTRTLSLIPLSILIVMADYRQNPISRRHTNHPSLTWISSEAP